MADEAESDAGPLELHADDLLDKSVFDVNGHKVGRVTLTREKAEHLLSFDVELARKARRAAGIRDHRLTLSPSDVLSTDHDVTIDDDLAHLAHPGSPPRI